MSANTLVLAPPPSHAVLVYIPLSVFGIRVPFISSTVSKPSSSCCAHRASRDEQRICMQQQHIYCSYVSVHSHQMFWNLRSLLRQFAAAEQPHLVPVCVGGTWRSRTSGLRRSSLGASSIEVHETLPLGSDRTTINVSALLLETTRSVIWVVSIGRLLLS